MSVRLTEREYQMFEAYRFAADRRDAADLLYHALKALLRSDRRRVPPEYYDLLFGENAKNQAPES